MAQNSISSELNDLLITHDFDVDALSTKTGKPAVNERGVPDASEADMFSFDWVGPTGKNYGTMVILLDQNGGMTVYFGDNLGRTMDPEDKKAWYGDGETGSRGFLEQLKHFAVRTSKIRGGFGLEDLSKLKYAIAGQAALTESFYGTKKVSYSGQPTEARLMIKHTRPITEGDKRYRYVESLFIETVEGERFRLPFRKLAGGRAMLEHVRQGGNPYDLRGQHIAETVNQLNVLSQFRRAHQGRVFEGAAGELVTETDQYYQRLNHNLKHMASSRGYNRYFESWKPADISEGDIMVEDLRGMFVETRIDPRIETALPMLAKIQQEANAMKEADIFESWAARLVEGTWSLPDTPEKMTQLQDWLSQERPLGPDAQDVTDVLYDLIGDDALFDQLQAMAEEDPNADAVPIVQAWIVRNKDQSPELSELAMSFQTVEPAPPAPEAAAAAPAPSQPPVAEGDNLQTFEDIIRLSGAPLKENALTDNTHHTLKHIIHTFKRDVRDFVANGDMSDDLFHALYDYYFDDMPYGTRKARDGDPYEWIGDRFQQDLGDHGMLDEAGVQVQKVRSPNMVQTQAVPSADIKSWKFNDDPLPHTDPASSPVPQGPDISLPMMDLDSSPVTGLDVTRDSNEPINECNYTMENEYCPVHGLKECWLEEADMLNPEIPSDFGSPEHLAHLAGLGKALQAGDRSALKKSNDAVAAAQIGQGKTPWQPASAPSFKKPGEAHAGQGGYDYSDEQPDQSDAETARLARSGTPDMPNDRKMNDADWIMSQNPDMPNDRRMNDADWIMSQNPDDPTSQAGDSDQSDAETARLGRYEDELARIKSLAQMR